MQRYMKRFSRLNDNEIRLLKRHFPLGFTKEDLSVIRTPEGASFEVLELHESDSVYLIRIDQSFDEVDWNAVPNTPSDDSLLDSLATGW